MKRALSATAATIAGLVFLVTFKVTPLEVDAVGTQPSPSGAPTGTRPLVTATNRTNAPTAAPSATPQGTPAQSGTFTGAAVRTIYGDVQVRIVVSGQRVSDVQAVLLPQDRAKSARISQYSSPILRSEAIQAQTARIDIVSGATYTSIAYGKSLDSALKQAHLG